MAFVDSARDGFHELDFYHKTSRNVISKVNTDDETLPESL